MKHGSGWIRPIEDIDHPSSRWNQGDIYLAESDICPGVQLEVGDSVVFFLYVDAKGLGAENCAQIWSPCGQAMRQTNQVAFASVFATPRVAVDFSCFCEDSDGDDSEDDVTAPVVQRTAIRLADILDEPTQPLGELPSVGSALHAEGECKRCSFFPKGTCQNGADCEFCHFEHENKPKQKNKGKRVRERQKAHLARFAAEEGCDRTESGRNGWR